MLPLCECGGLRWTGIHSRMFSCLARHLMIHPIHDLIHDTLFANDQLKIFFVKQTTFIFLITSDDYFHAYSCKGWLHISYFSNLDVIFQCFHCIKAAKTLTYSDIMCIPVVVCYCALCCLILCVHIVLYSGRKVLRSTWTCVYIVVFNSAENALASTQHFMKKCNIILKTCHH